MTGRPLPLRLEPLENEPWNGYLIRLASELITTTSVLRRFLGIDQRPPATPADHGIAMTEHTRNHCATLLNLDADQIFGMLLQRFDGRLLDLPQDVVEAFDPALPRPPSMRAATSRAGWMYTRHASRACPACLQAEPGRWHLSWRLPWHVHCRQHGLLIDLTQTLAPDPVRADDRCMAAEDTILALAYGEATAESPPLGYVAVLRTAVQELIVLRGGLRPQHPPAPYVLRAVLADAVEAVRLCASGDAPPHDGQSGNPQSWPFVRDALYSRGIACRPVAATTLITASPSKPRPVRPRRKRGATLSRQPDAQPTAARPTWLPEQIPMDIFAGALSDLLYPLRIRDGRHVAAIGGMMIVSDSPHEVAMQALGSHWRNVPTFPRTLDRLRAEGRDDQFWRDCGEAIRLLEQTSVDYTARVCHANDEAFRTELAEHTPSRLGGSLLHRWLLQDWACARITDGPYQAIGEREIRAIDPDLVATLRTGADQLAAARASARTGVA